MKNQQGFTLVELMAGVAVVGILAAVVAPSFKADAAKSKASEAKLELQRLAANATVYFQEHRKFPAGTAAVLPGADGDACKEAGKTFSVSSEWASDSVWSALDFQVEQSGRFSYHFETTSNKSARAWAVADPSCSGERRVYMVILEGRASGRVEWVMLDPDAPEPELPAVEGDEEDIDAANAGTPEAPTHEETTPGMDLSGTGAGTGTGGSAGGTGGDSNPLDGTDNNTSAGGSTGGSTGGTSSGGSSSGGDLTPVGETDGNGGAVGGDSYSGNGNGNGGNGGGNTGGGGTDSGSTSGGSTSGGTTSGGSTSGGSTSGGTATSACGGGGTAIVTCPVGYTLNLANCTCKKSK